MWITFMSTRLRYGLASTVAKVPLGSRGVGAIHACQRIVHRIVIDVARRAFVQSEPVVRTP